MTRFFLVGLLAMVLMTGCGSDNPPMGDGGSGGDGGTGGSFDDGGVGGSPACDQVPSLAGELGGQCRGDTFACNTGFECILEQPTFIGGPDDPIMNHPEPIDAPLFVDSYCTLPVAPTETGCDPDACFDECGFCSQGVCMKACQPESDTNSTCRPDYACDLFAFVCFPGCTSDDECRVYRVDDELVYNTSSAAVCDQETFRCEHPGTDGAEAGDPCELDDDCEANGICLQGPGGYCSKVGCDIAGIECEGEGTCASGLCLEACIVGSDETTEPENNTQGCREGYTCYWGRGEGDASGVCDVGVFNGGITDNNIGSACTSDAECYSPFGYGECDPSFGCTVNECGALGVPDDICGDEAICVDFIALEIDRFACLRTCALAEDCNPGDACIDLDTDTGTVDDLVCFPLCLRSSECRNGEVCDVNNQCVP